MVTPRSSNQTGSEIARKSSSGLTNRKIAENMVLYPRDDKSPWCSMAIRVQASAVLSKVLPVSQDLNDRLQQERGAV